MPEIKVSFIVPIYNVENYLSECLESILHQTIRGMEVILVNDGTKDNSMAVAEEFRKRSSSIRIIEKENGGISSARNAGLRAARGEYICFVDSDDFYTLDFAETFYRLCKEKNLDIIRGWYGIYDSETGRYLPHPAPKISYCEQVLSGEEFLCKSVSEHANEVVPWLGFFKRDYLQKNNIRFPEGIHYEEDQLFFLQALLCDPRCRVLQSQLEFYAYRKRGGSATKTPTIRQAQDVMFVVHAENRLLQEYAPITKAGRKAAKKYICSSFYQLTSIYGRVCKADKKKIVKMASFPVQMQCIATPYDRHQQMKIFLFTFARWLVDLVYKRVGS